MYTRFLNFIKERKIYLLCAFVSTIIISVIYCLNDVTPFGDKSLLCIDFYHQYGPMLGELYDRVKGFDNLIYSFNMAMGLPFFRNFFNYMSSPFNIIMFLFKREHLVTSYSFIIGAKAIVASMTFLYYLIHKFKKREIYYVAISILYAFSAYFIAYYWNIMWIDCMVFLPLITAGIEKIIDTGKYKLYLFSLAIMMFSNYFIAYMICIFSVIYYILYLFQSLEYKKKNIKKNLKIIAKKSIIFAFASIVSAMIVSTALIPMFKSMGSISATGGQIPTSQYYDFLPFDFVKGHLTAVDKTIFASDEVTIPNVSCGIISIFLLLAFIINPKIKIKVKIAYLFGLSFFIVAFFYAPLDYILHAFHVPNDLPYRYSFLYTFMLLSIAAISLKNIDKLKFFITTIIYVVLMLALGVMSMHSWVGITTNIIYINMVLLTLYFIFIAGAHFFDKFKKLFFIALVAVAALDVGISINKNWNITQLLTNFYSDYDETEKLLKVVENDNDDLFYRIENTEMMTFNDGSWYNYRGQTTFTSMAYESLAQLQHQLGLPGNNINSYYYAQTTPVFDMMFDLKYFIGNSNDTKRYYPIKTLSETANRFIYNVGLMYGVDSNIRTWNYQYIDPFVVQNDYIYKATGVEDVFTEATLVKTDEIYHDDEELILKYSYKNNNDNLYLYSDSSSVNYLVIGSSLYYNNDTYQNLENKYPDLTYDYLEDYNEKKIININSQDEYIEVYVSYNLINDNSLMVYDINHNKFEEAYDILIDNKVNMTSYNEYKMSGDVSLEEDKTIYTSIPYDDGWKVWIDDKKVETFKIGDALLAFNCSKGNHKIELKYQVPYLAISIPLTILGISLIIIDHKYRKNIIDYFKTKKRKNKKK